LHHDERKEKWYSCKYHSEHADILTHTTRLLNERYYGALQGLNKSAARRKYGRKKSCSGAGVMLSDHPAEKVSRMFISVPSLILQKRVFAVFLKEGKNVIIVSHGNVMRTILKHIDDIPAAYLPHLDLPSGKPIIYHYGKKGFSRMDGELGFDRPIFWDHEKQKH